VGERGDAPVAPLDPPFEDAAAAAEPVPAPESLASPGRETYQQRRGEKWMQTPAQLGEQKLLLTPQPLAHLDYWNQA
jgi:hypothetical protein